MNKLSRQRASSELFERDHIMKLNVVSFKTQHHGTSRDYRGAVHRAERLADQSQPTGSDLHPSLSAPALYYARSQV
jgi:hypothetical protein